MYSDWCDSSSWKLQGEQGDLSGVVGPDAYDEWVSGLPDAEVETAVASVVAGVLAVAESERVDAKVAESDIYYLPDNGYAGISSRSASG